MELKQGLIQVYTGNGKGKSTASIGQGIRAAGRGLQVYMVQFLKSSDSGELHIIKNIDNFEVFRFERPRGFFWTLNDQEKEELQEDIDKAMDFVEDVVKNKKCDVLIMDEAIGSINNGLIKMDRIVEILKNKPQNIEIVMTGRNIPDEIKEVADYVTEMKEIKHPYHQGIDARKGIEF